MDVLIVPSQRIACGPPVVSFRYWLRKFLLVQALYIMTYCSIVVASKYIGGLQESNLGFLLTGDCVMSGVGMLTGWIYLDHIQDSYVTYFFMIFSYRLVIIRCGLLLLGSLLWLTMYPLYYSSLMIVVWQGGNVLLMGLLVVCLNAVSNCIDSMRNSVVGVKVNFSRFPLHATVQAAIRKVSGEEIKLGLLTKSLFPRQRNENVSSSCAICCEPLLVGSFSGCRPPSGKNCRFNISLTRPKHHGSIYLFKTECGHTFHKSCLMTWIADKPIVRILTIGEPGEEMATASSSEVANCPLCTRGIGLLMEEFRLTGWWLLRAGILPTQFIYS